MGYRRSIPLTTWVTDRAEAIGVLSAAHAAVGDITGPGRPRELGRPLAHAYVLRLVAEFQGYVRDLHDLAAERLVVLARPELTFRSILVTAATEGRFLDRGNADVRSIEADFRRLGIGGLRGKLRTLNSRWDPPNDRGDQA